MRSKDTFNKKVRPQYDQNQMEKGLKIPAGIYRGMVVDTVDPRKMGRVKVQVIKFYGTLPPGEDSSTNVDPEKYLGAMWCRCMLPFGGVTPPAEGPTGTVSQNVYGASGPPPSLNNEVVVAFSGDSHNGIVMGVLIDDGKNQGLTGPGVTRPTATGETTIGQEISKTADSPGDLSDEHPIAERLRVQGLDRDRIRGQNYSSPTRDPSPRTMGMTSPTGHSVILDDGGFEDGDNLRMQLRTAGGAQILMDDTNGFTYITNREGNVWIEMNRNGDLDIYSSSSINMHTQGDYNLHVGGSFNVQAGRDINMKSQGAQGIKMEATRGSFNMKCAANMNLQADANGNVRVAGNYRETAGRIDMNGAPAAAASTPAVTQLAGNTTVTESVSRRVPEAEPWAGHLDVSVLDKTSTSGASVASESDSYYYGAPTNLAGYNDQTGEFDLNEFPDVESSAGDLLQYTSGVDRAIDPALIELVTEVARRFGRPLLVTSGFRDQKKNAAVSGASKSQHMRGHAVDISSGGLTNKDRLDLIKIASSIGITGIGVYNGGSLHFDNRTGQRFGWGSKVNGKYTLAGVPSYARAYIDKHMTGRFV